MVDKAQMFKVLIQVGASLVPAGNVLAEGLPKVVAALTERETDADGKELSKDAIVKSIIAKATEGEAIADEQIEKAQDVIAKDRETLDELLKGKEGDKSTGAAAETGASGDNK